MSQFDVKLYKKPSNVPSNYNVISVSFFLSKDAYKNVRIYINGLRILIDRVINKLPSDYYLYLYHDKTIEETKHPSNFLNNLVRYDISKLLDYLKRNDRVFLFRYDYPQFKDPTNDFYHVTTFGTMVRFLPLFDYPENKNLNIVMVSDIDIRDNIDDFVTQFHRTIETTTTMPDASIYIGYVMCYYLTTWSRIKRLENLTFLRVRAGSLLSKVRFPHKLFDDYMKALINGTAIYPEDKEDMDLHINVARQTKGLSKGLKFYYGYDENFLDAYVLPWIIKNKLIILAYVIPFVKHVLVKYILTSIDIRTNNYQNLNAHQKEVMKNIIQYVLQKDLAPNISVNDAIWEIRGIIKADGKSAVLSRFREAIYGLSQKDAKAIYLSPSEYKCFKELDTYEKCSYIKATYDKKGAIQYQCLL